MYPININIYFPLLILFCCAAIVQLGFLIILKYRKELSRSFVPPQTQIPVSVIICAKNESHNLQRFLPFVLEQDYPKDLFEVIVVNDQSTDDSGSILSTLEKQYGNLKIISIPVLTDKKLPGKKNALSKGIAAAKHRQLILTDADCRPASDQWIKTISTLASHEENVLLGYGAYEYRPGLLNRFIRWETVNTCMQYASYAAIGTPYMGVGRNLSYSKSLLDKLASDKEFQAIYKTTPSGDDDLIISKIADKENTSVFLMKIAHTISLPQPNWKAWWKQKTRHGSTGKYYPAKVKTLLGLYALSHSIYWLLGLPLLIYGIINESSDSGNLFLKCGILLFSLRLALYWLNASIWYRQLNEKKILLFYPFGDLGWAIYNVLLSPYIFWKNKQTWK